MRAFLLVTIFIAFSQSTTAAADFAMDFDIYDAPFNEINFGDKRLVGSASIRRSQQSDGTIHVEERFDLNLHPGEHRSAGLGFFWTLNPCQIRITAVEDQHGHLLDYHHKVWIREILVLNADYDTKARAIQSFRKTQLLDRRETFPVDQNAYALTYQHYRLIGSPLAPGQKESLTYVPIMREYDRISEAGDIDRRSGDMSKRSLFSDNPGKKGGWTLVSESSGFFSQERQSAEFDRQGQLQSWIIQWHDQTRIELVPRRAK